MRSILIRLGLLALFITALSGCGGSDGAAGAPGADGADVDPALVTQLQTDMAALKANVRPEQCSVCHDGQGDKHQDVYKPYVDASNLKATILSVASAASGVTFNTTVTFKIEQKDANGIWRAYEDVAGLPSFGTKALYATTYDSATRTFGGFNTGDGTGIANANGYVSIGLSGTPTATPGTYTVTKNDLKFAPELTSSQVYGYIAKERINFEQPAGSHITPYNNVSNFAMAYGAAAQGAVGEYVSLANVSGCERCHGTPYLKHAYRGPQVTGLNDFQSCRTCHYTERNSNGAVGFKILATDPARYATIHDGTAPATTAEKATYATKATLMQMVHTAHAMEFPYPQPMANCATCHAGKIAQVTADANYRLDTCTSCHPVEDTAELAGNKEVNRAPSLRARWKIKNVESTHATVTSATDCSAVCHNGSIAPKFSTLHTGYNLRISKPDGTKWSDTVTVTIDSASWNAASSVLSVGFTASGIPDTTVAASGVQPTLMVGLFGYDSKDFLVSPHNKDVDDNGDGTVGNSPDSRNTEAACGTAHPRVTCVAGAVSGGVQSWTATVNLSAWAGKITDKSVKRLEIGVRPKMVVATATGGNGNKIVALKATSKTFDLAANAFNSTFFTAIIDEAKCNKCHDALAVLWHDGDRSGNIKQCRMCHTPKNAGSHLEMQSRSIDSYVHAIHSFQNFDQESIDYADPVKKMRAEMHAEHVFPNFTIRNCEACHNAGTYNVPNQAKSLPGVLSSNEVAKNLDRAIGTVSSAVTGPAARACGACHRSKFIKEDDAAGLASFYRHMKEGGYVVDVTSTTSATTWESVVGIIMVPLQ